VTKFGRALGATSMILFKVIENCRDFVPDVIAAIILRVSV